MKRAELRRAHERFGRIAELIAAVWLIAKGYRILARRARTPFGEVDLIALKAGVLVAVEVKARHDARAALDAIGPRQRERIARGVLAWASARGLGGTRIRFDVVVQRPFALPLHRRGAWWTEQR